MSEMIKSLENILKFLKENNYDNCVDMKHVEMLIGSIKYVSNLEDCKEFPMFVVYNDFAIANHIIVDMYIRSRL
jgi:hypothetical protein